MLKDDMYWKWKSMIIDFSKLPNDKNEYGGYITKKDMVFHYLGTPDKEEHRWYNGGWSSEYNEALRYAFELDLVEKVSDDNE